MTNKEGEQFLSRWSRRKLEPESEKTIISVTEDQEVSTTKPEGDATETASEEQPSQQAPLPILQQDIAPELKKQALRALFRKPEFSQLDGLNEYDDDFTSFAKLGDIVPHDMKRMLDLAKQQLAETTQQKTPPQSTPDKDGLAKAEIHPKYEEDDNLA